MTFKTRSWRSSTALRLTLGAATALLIAGFAAVDQLIAQVAPPAAPVVGANVNMIEGPTFLRPGPAGRPQDLVIQGDPLQNANGFELSCGISTRNPLHYLCFANDNRAVDIPGTPPEPGEDGDASTLGDSSIGMYQSINGGGTWASTLHPGFFPMPLGYDYAADPGVSCGAAGVCNSVGLASFRNDKEGTAIYQSTWIDLNDQEGDSYPAKHVFTSVVDKGNTSRRMDRPTVLVTEPQGATATFQVDRGNGKIVAQTVPVSPVHVGWTVFIGGGKSPQKSQLMVATSLDGGRTFKAPTKLSEELGLSQGLQLAKKKNSQTMCAAWRKGSDKVSAEGIAVACSSDAGASYKKATVPITICPVDWGTTPYRFRTLTVPTITADDQRFYMAWAERPRLASGACDANSTTSRVNIATSTDGVTWTKPAPIDPYVGPGFQIFPKLVFNGTSVSAVWFDSRHDEALPALIAANSLPNSIDEAPIVANPAGKRRHTIDVVGVRALPATNPVWSPSVAVSKYTFAVKRGTTTRTQVQFNFPNVRLFAQMTQPGLGDYIAATSEQLVPANPITQPGVWAPNLGQLGDSPVWTAWADNRNVRMHSNEDYSRPRDWAPPALPELPDGAGTSIYDSTQMRPACNADLTGMRDQNPYGALLTRGSLIGALGNNRPMLPAQSDGKPSARTMPVFAQNLGTDTKLYRFELFNQPPGGKATFKQFPAPGEAPQTFVEGVGTPHTTVTRTAFVTSSAARPPIRVDVFEIPMPAKAIASMAIAVADTTGKTIIVSAPGHGFTTGDPVVINGVRPVEYNGTYVLTRIDNNTFSYQLNASPADRTITTVGSASAPARSQTPAQPTRKVWFNADPSQPAFLETPASAPPNDPKYDVNKNEVQDIDIGTAFVKDSNNLSNLGWQQAGWQEAGWQEAGWQEAGWQEAGWQEAGWQEAGWQEAGWQEAGWQEAGWQEAGWQEAGWQEAGWQEAGWQEAGWQEGGWESNSISPADLQAGVVVRDVKFAIKGKGNGFQQVKVASLLNGKVTPELRFQFVAFRLSTTGGAGPNSCDRAHPSLVSNKQVLVNIDNTNVSLANFLKTSTDPSSITIPVGPGETVFGNLRIFDTHPGHTLPPLDGIIPGGEPSAVGTADVAAGVTSPPPPTAPLTIVQTTPPPIAMTGNAYSFQLQALGGDFCAGAGSLQYTWSVVGSLPAGLSLNPTTGLISGTPTAGGSFTIQVTDNNCPTPDSDTATFNMPLVRLPSPITQEATGPGGAIVTFAPTVEGESTFEGAILPVAVSCVPPSGSTFPIAPSAPQTTTVTCTAADASPNGGTGSFPVTIVDTTPPTIASHLDVTAEATGASGAAVTYTSPATSDLVDGASTAICAPASGSLFALADTTVTCNKTDAHGNAATAKTFVVHVVDTTPPVIAAHLDVTTEAAGASGATVTYTSPATSDAVDGASTAICLPASGTLFPLTNTTVTCNKTDAHGNAAIATTFVVHVVDTTPPIIAAHADVTKEATGSTGATVTYTSPATSDAVDGASTAVCLPASGSVFALGNTTVTCNKTDTHGNAAMATSFVAHVLDTTPPVLTVPSNIITMATSLAGKVIAYSASATDAVDGAVTAICLPASGSTFPIGTTTVNCSATDVRSNSSNASFTVQVTNPGVFSCAAPTFSGPQIYSASNFTPQFPAIADFNGDGKPDVAVNETSGGNQVAVMLGDGLGGFGAATHFAVGTNPLWVIAKDLNNDGKVDLAVANNGNGTLVAGGVSVLLGDGLGGFAAAVNFAVPGNPVSLVPGDFNNDGKLDLVVGNNASGTSLNILFGTGTPSLFGAATPVAAGPGTIDMVVEDFDGDGNLDIAVPNQGTHAVNILKGNGAGGFTSTAITLADTTARTRKVGDVNGDGKPDLGVTTFDNSGTSSTVNLLLFLNNGSGGFTAAPVQLLPRTLNFAWTQPGDFNGDGKLDLLVTGSSTNIVFLQGDGAGGYAAPVPFIVGSSQVAAGVADLNGDGTLDVVGAQPGDGDIYVLMNNCGAAMNADLSIAVNPPSVSVVAGATPTVTITISNAGPDPATSIRAEGDGDAGYQAIDVMLSQGACGNDGCDIGTIAPGGTATITLTMRALGAGTHAFNLIARAAEADPTPLNNYGTATAIVSPQALTFTVTNTGDNDEGTLRGAIEDSNTNTGASTPNQIVFNITPLAATYSIPLTFNLPVITTPVVLDATTQPGFAGAPIVEINGQGFVGTGLSISAGGTTVRGLVLNRIPGNAMFISGGAGDVIEGNYIGTNLAGTAAAQNGNIGIVVDAPATIGGTTPAARNVISGNSTGIFISASTSGTTVTGSGAGSVVAGNYIGTSADGTAAIPNNNNGVSVVAANVVVSGNVISGNGGPGVSASSQVVLVSNVPTVVGSSAGLWVKGNLIGTDKTGTIAVPNGNAFNNSGVSVSAPNAHIGGTAASERNVISGNKNGGINLNFQTSGTPAVVVGAATNTLVEGNYIGVDVSGNMKLANGTGTGNGIFISTSNNTIGGTAAGAGNIIAGNNSNGLSISHNTAALTVPTDGNFVYGNYIGVNASGAAMGNTTGVSIFNGASSNLIGGTAAGARNVISGNTSSGVSISVSTGQTATGNQVVGNYIGVSLDGLAARGNGSFGINASASGTGVVTGTIVDSNVISGNVNSGLSGSLGGGSITVTGNLIGTDKNGTVALANGGGGGIFLSNTSGSVVGGTIPAARNVIAGNTGTGLSFSSNISGGVASANTIQGNYIGVDATGNNKLANTSNGISLSTGSGGSVTGTQIGGTAAGAGNIIAGNGSNGVSINSGVTTTTIQGNFIGTNGAGTAGLGNTSSGISIFGSSGNTIGGVVAGAANVISGNGPQTGPTGFGVGVSIGSSSSSNTVQGNRIGTNPAGTAALPNRSGGISIDTSSNNTIIGGTTALAGNLISGNGTLALASTNVFANAVFVGSVTGTQILGNYIGTDVTGTSALPNFGVGVQLTAGGTGTVVGGTAAGAGNVISGNGDPTLTAVGQGIGVFGNANTIQGNKIGTDATGLLGIPNRREGIGISNNASNNVIGGTSAGAANIIAFNANPGVWITSGTGNVMRGNSFVSNTGIGIDLGGSGVTLNDVGDGDTGPNNFQNFPIVTVAGSGAGTTLVAGTLNSLASTTFALDFYANAACDPSGNGEGQRFLGSTSVLTDASGNVAFTAILSASSTLGEFVTATATDPSGNTSEFSLCRTVTNSGVVSGQVTDAGTTAPLANITMKVYDAGGVQVTTATTDASGNYQIALSPATYFLRTSNTLQYLDQLYNGMPCWAGCSVTAGTPLTVTVATATTANIALTKGGRISGTVISVVTSAPVPGMPVGIYDSGGTLVVSTSTDVSGNYFTGPALPTGNYFARTNAAFAYQNKLWNNIACAPTCVVTTGTSISVTAPNTTVGINFSLTPVATSSTVAYVVGQIDDPAPGNSGIQKVTVIDVATNNILARISAGLSCQCINPDSIVVKPDGTLVYVSNELDNSVSVIDTSSNGLVAMISGGFNRPTAVAVSPDGTKLYVANDVGGAPYVSIINTATYGVLATIPLAVIDARGMAITPDGSRLYVSTYGGNSVVVIDTATNAVVGAPIPVGNLPVGVDVTPNGAFVYVSNLNDGTVSVISTTTNTVVASVNVTSGAQSARVTPDGSRVYVANAGISIINTGTNSVVGSVSGASAPRTLEFTPSGARAYTAAGTSVQIIDTASNTVILTIPFNVATDGDAAAIAIKP